MSDFLGLFSDDDKSQNVENENSQNISSTQDNQSNESLQLHKEELDITKNNVDAGEVVLSKDVVEEQKTVDVPVMHEEVVIKRTPMNNERSDASISSEETIHIPVSQEQVEVNKYTVTTEEVSAAKRQVEETRQVQETLKHEEANVNTTGSVDIVSDGSGFGDINNS
ncbi:YsnF/AvaK domain-containing protein [Bacillus sp. EB600]|uniref:YsnF/AvaK domain-containing protein n=1 Tax=Bacillus sp. EB600 TaxID=2806345 RepID=UPI00210F2042|nr:YsnF/AvaK domain-containing protein [Bacillus sp. EB600]MCQ6279367.1 YsnF/AvaK domain-containing protein [Bacillus sp. EB600]